MKKLIFIIFLITFVCFGLTFAQTKKRVVRKRVTTKQTVKKNKKGVAVKRKIDKKMTANAAVTTESGLTYIVTKQGDGAQIKKGDNVIVNYTGLLTNGAMFDSSLNRNETFSFQVGAGMVIQGWDEGLQKLKVGDHATLIIPSTLGYGERGAGGVIPPNATLIFLIEVVGVK